MKKFKKEYLNEAFDKLNFKELTDVQEKVYQLDNQKQNLIIEAKTGSGKTHAFLLPILESIEENGGYCQAVILAPTRELALQINKFLKELTEHSPKEIKVDLITGGLDRDQIISKLNSRQPDILIGTPGRIHDLVFKENVLKIHEAKYFIIDEADMTLDDHFIVEVDHLASVASDAKFWVFSATIPEQLQPFLKKYLKNPLVISVHPEEISNLNISHYFIKSRERKRLVVLEEIIEAINPYLAIIFCNTKESVEEVNEFLLNKKANVMMFHGGIPYRKRKQLIKRINNLEFQYIVATDILARGIDIVGVSHIINYELPLDTEFYIHRTGRTGRVEMDGIAISIYEFSDNQYLDKLESKGVKTSYKEIKNNKFVDVNIRNKRDYRKKNETKIEKIARANVKKPKKVKPGYKKKYRQKLEIEKKKLHRMMKK
ncbi:MAG: DEAD/DEAH box helicase [Candidatus Izimaplasma sp.]|nr:DEAD/DEAH box helicase [Candidatus Izimaplasma bacterium]